jgi:tetratricopeptide (TPR) repeat protein
LKRKNVAASVVKEALERVELHKLLETQSQKKSVGTLTLNKNKRFREIFFEEDAIYLVGEIYSGKIAVSDVLLGLIKADHVSIGELQALPTKTDLTGTTLPEVLFQRGTISEQDFSVLLSAQLLEEIVDLFFNNELSFHFQEGRVPENLLDTESLVASTPVQISDVLDELRRRNTVLQKLTQLVPSADEVFVVTEMGMSYKQGRSYDIVLQEVFDLMDGFRDLKTIVRDSGLFEFDILSLIVETLEHGNLKKTLHPELKGISTNALSLADAENFLPYYKNAVKYGVDEIAARERLAAVYEKLQNVDDAVIQYNFIGDALYRMNKASKAVRAYQRALALKPGEPLITDKIWKIYIQAAEEELEQDRVDAAIPLLQAALRLRPDETTAFEPLAQALLAKERYKEIGELLDFLRAEAKKSGDSEAALHAFKIVTDALPKHAGFQRKLINLYLDCERLEEAQAAMLELANVYEQQGARSKARELREKVERVGTGKAVSRKRREKRPRKESHRLVRTRAKSAVALRCFFAFFVLFFFYQACSLVVWSNVKAKHKVVLALGMDPPPERMDFQEKSYEGRNQRFAADCKVFLNRFPRSLFLPEAEEFYQDARSRASELRARRDVLKRARLGEAKRLLDIEGDPNAALEIVEELAALRNEPGIEIDVERLREQATDSTEPTSRDLKKRAEQLVEEGHWKEAYEQFRRLLFRYPDSRPAGRITLPVVVESLPAGAAVLRIAPLLGEKQLGTTPFQTRMAPGSSRVYVLRQEGYFDQEIELLEPDRGEAGVRRAPHLLKRRPLWSNLLPSPLAAPPTLAEGILFLGTRDGGLFWFQPTGQKRGEWKAPPNEIQTVNFKPAVSEGQVYVVWNNARAGRLTVTSRHGRNPPLHLTQKYSLGKLASTPFCVLPRRSMLVVGTRGGGLRGWSSEKSGGIERGWQTKIGAEATVVYRYTPSGSSREELLVGTDGGDILRFTPDVNPTKPPLRHWKQSVSPSPIVEIMRFGDQIAVRTTKTAELLLLDAVTGVVRAHPTLFGNRSLAFLPQKEAIYALAENGDVTVMSPGAEKLTTTERTREPETGNAVGLVPLWNSLGVLYASEKSRNEAAQRLFVFDTSSPTNLRLLWATRTPGPIDSAVSDGEWVAIVSSSEKDESRTHVEVHRMGQPVFAEQRQARQSATRIEED